MSFSGGRAGNSLLKSFVYAWRGILHVFRTQRNFRIHLAVAVLVLLAGVGVGMTSLELALLALTIALVLVAEVINTGVEAAVDLVTLDHEPRAEIAKDVAAGAVLLSAVFSVVVGILVFVPHLVRLFY